LDICLGLKNNGCGTSFIFSLILLDEALCFRKPAALASSLNKAWYSLANRLASSIRLSFEDAFKDLSS
ncbi:hypothetical protein KCV07_g121, partial [Aureobasidium melanogenum]